MGEAERMLCAGVQDKKRLTASYLESSAAANSCSQGKAPDCRRLPALSVPLLSRACHGADIKKAGLSQLFRAR